MWDFDSRTLVGCLEKGTKKNSSVEKAKLQILSGCVIVYR